MKHATRHRIVILALVATIGSTAWAADLTRLPLGREIETEGVIVKLGQEGFQMRNHFGREYQVSYGPSTRILEKKTNPFREAERFDTSDLVLGLNVRIEGRGDLNGAVLAEKIRFTRDELRVARTITSRVQPVEARLDASEAELEETHQQLQQTRSRTDSLESQVEELDDAFYLARREARDAQLSADHALQRVAAVSDRVSALDDYTEVDIQAVYFEVNSSRLNGEAQAALDDLADRARTRPAYLVEVAGFASADGTPAYNRELSRRRADAVVDYLVTRHGIELRRIVRPFGFGETMPAADNATPEGRRKNRRVEVRVLQSDGIAGTSVTAAAHRPPAGLP